MTPGEAAYERWRLHLTDSQLKRVKTIQIQPWDKLLPATKSIWESVADAAILAAAEIKYRAELAKTTRKGPL